MPGSLYVVATPIGNLEDITYRAIRILRDVDKIACEDTRHVRKLLDHYGIARPLVSYHEHNEVERTRELIDEIRAGRNIAVVTDAGTPLISDPGYRIVSGAIAEGITVVPVPGPAAAIAALMASGLPTDAFYFGGFLPPKKGQRRALLERIRNEASTVVFYEAPHRILESLSDIVEVLGDTRRIVAAREITKMHEEFIRGTVAEVHAELSRRTAIKGEITILIAKAERVEQTSDQPLAEAVNLLIAGGLSRMEAIKAVARQRGVGKREVYQALQEHDP
jgi:16S rRNA (cytidine1402-2'-O)-methyltransferase